MTEQPHHSSLIVNPVSNKSPCTEALMNGSSGNQSKVYIPNSENEADDNENVCVSNVNGSHAEEIERSVPNASDIKDAENIMREKMSDAVNGQVNYTDTEVNKQSPEKTNMEKYDSETSSTENLGSESRQDSRDMIVVHKIREIDYLTDKLDNNFDSSMDRKSSAESGFEEQGNLSNTDSLEKKPKLAKDESSVSDLSGFESDGAKDVMTLSYSSAVSSTGSPVSSPSDFLSDMSMSTVLQQEVEPLIDEDSSTSVSCSFGNSLSDSTCSSGNQTPDIVLERSMSDSGMSPVHFEEVSRSLPTSKSIEKVTSIHKSTKEPNVVRASKSHENYLHNQDFQFVAIDIDDITYSLDQIPQNPTPTLQERFDHSFDAISQQSSDQDSLVNSFDETDSKNKVSQWDEKETQSDSISDVIEKCLAYSEAEAEVTRTGDPFDQTNVSEQPVESAENEPKPCDTTFQESNVNTENFNKCYRDNDDLVICDNAVENLDQGAALDTSKTTVNDAFVGLNTNVTKDIDLDKESHITNESKTSELSDETVEFSDDILTKEFGPDGLFYQPPVKHIDQPSAQRLAKRLYNLDGFQKSDVSRHLGKKNDFSTTVAEEYLKLFNFTGDTLDVALRKFLKQFSLIGETQERERVLAHFSHQYLQNNPNTFDSEDACHTLVCAIMLLNTDLHGQAVGRKMTCNEFIENLSELNDGVNFHKDVLKAIYNAIKAEPIEWAPDEEFTETNQVPNQTELQQSVANSSQFVGRNPFLDVSHPFIRTFRKTDKIPDPSQTTEYKKGYIMRKCCLEPEGRKTPLGRRSWKMYFAVQRDMVLYLHKDEHEMKKKGLAEGSHNVILTHHCLASKASDYSKKQHVFRLQTADWAEYLFQTSNSKELQDWIDTVNYVAASLSAPPLPGAVGSQKKFQRPLLPVSYTKLNLQDQLTNLQERLTQTEEDLKEHQTYPPEKGSKSSLIQHYIEKESYLEFEIKRLQTYIHLIQAKLKSHPELKPTLVETSIGENEEYPQANKSLDSRKKSPVQRSISDRGSRFTAVDMNVEPVRYIRINEKTEVTRL